MGQTRKSLTVNLYDDPEFHMDFFNDSISMTSRQENVVTVFPEIEVVFSRCVSFAD